MSTYEALKGLKVKYLSADTSGDREVEGELYYNSADFKLKSHLAVGAWSASGNMVTPQRDGGDGAGSSPRALCWVAGGTNGSTRNITTTQKFVAGVWANNTSINTGREEAAGFGSQTAAVLAGGSTYPPSTLKAEVEEYNGNAWSEVTNIPATRKQGGGIGTLTAGAVVFGRLNPPAASGTDSATTLEYDGTSWTAGGAGNTARSGVGSGGTLTAGIVFGGEKPPSAAASETEEYDGSSWTAGGALNNARVLLGGSGIQTSALACGGGGYSAKTEVYNGTTWSNFSDMAVARNRFASGGTTSAAGMAAGGLVSPGSVEITEEWDISTSTITKDTWAAGGALPAVKNDSGGAGTLTAGLQVGGTRQPSNPNTGGLSTAVETNEYNGTAWTAGGDMNTGRATFGNLGTQTAALAFGGRTTNNPFTYTANSEEYNGSAWTEGNNLGAVMYYMNRTGCGTQTAGLSVGGYDADAGSPTSNVQEYDGTSWSEVNNAPTALLRIAGAGVQTAAILCGNQTNPKSATYLYDGTNWTVSPSSSNGANGTTFAGTQAGGIVAAGAPVPYNGNLSFKWDGTTFSNNANISIGRESASASSESLASNFICGGNNPSAVQNTTEEYTDGVVISSVAKSIDFD